MSEPLLDATARALATDPFASYIVQAPAGSGKTELLTQRFLRLLGQVNAPEHIVALTFTRKAAGEMRERVLHALHRARSGTTPQSPHQQLTYDYATAALTQNDTHHWQLLEQPHRLRIMTIDSLCQMLSSAIPLMDKDTPFTDIHPEPHALYQEAARACIQYAIEMEALQPALKTVLSHLDNRQDRLVSLLVRLLATREQWLGMLYDAKAMSQPTYEAALKAIETHELERLALSTPNALKDTLCDLSRTVAEIEHGLDSPRAPLRNWHTFAPLTREHALALASLLLTSSGSLRKRFDHHVGLSKANCQDPLYSELKAQSQVLMEALEQHSEFKHALTRVSRLPLPQYDEEQWHVLQALFTLLPLLTAHLQLLFKERNACDFSAISQQALFALGDEDSPTDLTLYLDNTIHHLLMDEFQDTSLQQYHLLQKLVMGWEKNDGKTLFIVGDPMQSIYRFRQAEVGLFLKAQQEGIGSVALIPLQLRCNFRSKASIVAWVNQQFQSIFPKENDIEAGAITFHPSTSVHEDGSDVCIIAKQYDNKMLEAQALVGIIEQELSAPSEESIAVLVRSRSHLHAIIPLLREKGIAFQGVEIEKLSLQPHINDMWTLCRCLMYPADRLAWLSFLRSPWCGLSLADIHIIANHHPKSPILFALSELDDMKGLSEQGRQRAHYCYAVLHDAIHHRYQEVLENWVLSTAERLHSQHLLHAQQHEDLEQFWQLLEQHGEKGQIKDITLFQNAFDSLYSQQSTPSRLHIMTIHKSKGLEFDCVILPGLGNTPPQKDTPLLRFMRLPSKQHEDLLLLSPIRAAHAKHCPLYDYLGDLDAEKGEYELQRLLYVAATRAKKRLYLLDNQNNSHKKSTLRHLLQQVDFTTPDTPEHTEDAPSRLPLLQRLPQRYYVDLPSLSTAENPLICLTHSSTLQRDIGVLTHEMLQWICTYHPSSIDDIPWALLTQRLQPRGLTNEHMRTFITPIHEHIERFLSDPIGQWIAKAHEDERNEYEWLINQRERTTTRIIDRTFIDNGTRWVIDFKTGAYHEQHREQVNAYAALFAHLESLPIRCGLYYLEGGDWVDWGFSCQRNAS